MADYLDKIAETEPERIYYSHKLLDCNHQSNGVHFPAEGAVNPRKLQYFARMPHLSKHAFYSAYADIIRRVVDHFKLSLSQVCELIYPICMSNGPFVYRSVLEFWISTNNIPDDHLSFA